LPRQDQVAKEITLLGVETEIIEFDRYSIRRFRKASNSLPQEDKAPVCLADLQVRPGLLRKNNRTP
jgi:hypothetical protein